MPTLIIPAAGTGQRMMSEIPKQFLLIDNVPIIIRTIKQFIDTIAGINIVVALHPSYISYWKELCETYPFAHRCRIVIGGDSRFESVKSCVNILSDNDDIVLVHDAVRPFVSSKLILSVIEKLKYSNAVIPCTPIIDSLREVAGVSSRHFDRKRVVAVQTPQAFKANILKFAYNNCRYDETITDDASVIEKMGVKIELLTGEEDNIKITTQRDLKFGEFLINFSKK